MKKVGRVGGKALLYFEVVSTFALVIGLVVANVIQPGRRVQRRSRDARRERGRRLRQARRRRQTHGRVPAAHHPAHVLRRVHRLGRSAAGAVRRGALRLRDDAHGHGRQRSSTRSSRPARTSSSAMMNALMKLAPLGAGGAMAFTIGRYGVDALKPLALLMGSFYLTCLLFVLVVLGIDRRVHRLQHPALHPLHQGGAADRARHVVVGVGAGAADAEARAARLLEVGGRPGRAVRLLVQPRRHQHLPDDGGAVRRAGAQHRSDAAGSS